MNVSSPSAADRLAGPGERHRLLAPLIGSWHIEMSTRPDGGKPIRSNDVRAEKRWFADGRYIREEVRGSFAGKPHEKLTLLGFNNVRQRYEYVTADNNDAVILLYVSQPNAALGDGSCIETFAHYASGLLARQVPQSEPPCRKRLWRGVRTTGLED